MEVATTDSTHSFVHSYLPTFPKNSIANFYVRVADIITFLWAGFHQARDTIPSVLATDLHKGEVVSVSLGVVEEEEEGHRIRLGALGVMILSEDSCIMLSCMDMHRVVMEWHSYDELESIGTGGFQLEWSRNHNPYET